MQLCSDAELFLIGCGGKQEQKGRQFKELSDGRKKKEQRSEVLAAQRRAAAQVGCADRENKPDKHERGRIQSHPPKPG